MRVWRTSRSFKAVHNSRRWSQDFKKDVMDRNSASVFMLARCDPGIDLSHICFAPDHDLNLGLTLKQLHPTASQPTGHWPAGGQVTPSVYVCVFTSFYTIYYLSFHLLQAFVIPNQHDILLFHGAQMEVTQK